MIETAPFPILQLTIGGELLPGPTLEGLTGLRMQQRFSQPSLCELYFRDPPGPSGFLESISPGQAIQVWVQGSPQALFSGDVTAVEYHYLPNQQYEIYLRAYDRLHRLRKRQTVRTFEDISLVSLARTVCRDLDLAPLKFPGSPLTWPLLVQHSQSDLGLLVELASLEGLYLTLQENDLRLMRLDGLPELAIPLRLGENLFEAHLEVNVDAASDQVVAWGWNSDQVEAVHAVASVPRSGRQVPARVSVAAAGGSPQHSLVNQVAPTREHAVALAKAEIDRRAASEVIFQGTAAGNPDLRPGRLVEVTGVAHNVAGRYVVTQATHVIDASGYRTELDSTPPEVPARPLSDVATFGEVINVDDPEGHARVRVRLPTFNNILSGWLPVVVPGAGASKGLLTLPDTGDTVVVLLLRGTPGLVLGGLYGRLKAPESGVELGRVRAYTWITPGNQKIQLHDELLGGKIRIENDSGAYIELNGGHITIAGREIDFIQT